MSNLSELLNTLLNKEAEEAGNDEFEKIASEVYHEGYLDGFTAAIEKMAAEAVTPNPGHLSPAGDQVEQTIANAVALTKSPLGGGAPQVVDSNEEGAEATEKEAAENALLEMLLEKLAGTDEDVEASAEEAQADMMKQAMLAAIKSRLS